MIIKIMQELKKVSELNVEIIRSIHKIFSTKETIKYLPFQNIPSLQEIDSLISELMSENNHLWMIYSDAQIVWIINVIDLWDKTLSLAYVIWSKFSRKWIGSQVVSRIINIIFWTLSYDTIQAPVTSRNIWSQKVLTKNWFHKIWEKEQKVNFDWKEDSVLIYEIKK